LSNKTDLKRIHRNIVLAFFALMSMWATAAHASVTDSVVHTFKKDTTEIRTDKKDTVIIASKPARRKSSLNDTWYLGSEPNKRYLIDTGIAKMHYYDVARRDGAEYFHLGNAGSETYPLVFNPASNVGFNMGFRQFDAYRYRQDSIRYYQVIRPYAEIFYYLGINKDQIFQGRFANSHKSGIFYGVDFRRMNSNGTYSNQKALDNGFSLYGVYNTKNKAFNIETDLIYNSFIVQENGGLATDIFFKDTSVLTKSLAPINLTQAVLNYNEIDWFLKASYGIGKKYNERVNDTLERRVVMPVFRVSYQFDVERNRYSYFDLRTDSAYYSKYLNTGDTLKYNSQFVKIGQRFGLDYTAKKLTSDSTFKELNFLMGASASLDYYILSEYGLKDKFTNLYVTGYIKSNPGINSRLIYKATVAYYLAGYNQNDLSADGQLGVDLRQFGRLTAGASYQLKQSDWAYHSFRTDSTSDMQVTNTTGGVTHVPSQHLDYSYSSSLPKMSTFKVGGEYSVEKIGIKVSAYNYVLKNYFYYSGPTTPTYESKAINMLVLSFANRFGFKGVHFDNDLWFQKAAGSDVIRLPLITLKSSLYYERHVFKNALWFAVGADVRYYTPFNANGYNPLTGQFYEQNVQQMKFYPVLDVFLNAKIKTVRIFLVGTNLSSFFGKQKGYYTAYYYPAADASFKFGASWRFFE
jgi:hypothetical protein